MTGSREPLTRPTGSPSRSGMTTSSGFARRTASLSIAAIGVKALHDDDQGIEPVQRLRFLYLGSASVVPSTFIGGLGIEHGVHHGAVPLVGGDVWTIACACRLRYDFDLEHFV